MTKVIIEFVVAFIILIVVSILGYKAFNSKFYSGFYINPDDRLSMRKVLCAIEERLRRK